MSSSPLFIVLIYKVVILSLAIGLILNELWFVNASIDEFLFREIPFENIVFILHIQTVHIFGLNNLFAWKLSTIQTLEHRQLVNYLLSVIFSLLDGIVAQINFW